MTGLELSSNFFKSPDEELTRERSILPASPDERRKRIESREELETWSRNCERMPDQKLLKAILARDNAVDFRQRQEGEAVTAEETETALAYVEIEESRLQVAKDVWSDRKGWRGKSPVELVALRNECEIQEREATKQLQAAQEERNAAAKTGELRISLQLAGLELRLIDERTLALEGKSEAEIDSTIQALTREYREVSGKPDGPGDDVRRAERHLRITRDAYAVRRGFTRMASQKLRSEESRLQSRRETLQEMNAGARRQIGRDLSPSDAFKSEKERLEPINAELHHVEEDLEAIHSVLNRRKSKP